MTAHKHAELMLQYAQDATETDAPWTRWEMRGGPSATWYTPVREICFASSCEYRHKPKTMTYTITIPEPLREAPEVGEKYWLVEPLSERLAYEYTWIGGEIEMLCLKRGLCFATKEDAIAAAKAMMPIKVEEA